MNQETAILICAVAFVMMLVAGWYYLFYRDALELVPLLTVALFIGTLIWSTNDNFYDVKSGVVVAQHFTPAHYDYVLVNKVLVPQWRPDDWAIQVRSENGRTGWFHYGENVFGHYPEGSHYP